MVGIDIVKISRIAEAMEKERFCDKILNKVEQDYSNGKSKIVTKFGFNSIAMTVAGLFAAKEAVLKAIGVGMSGGYGFKDITIDHNKKGAPVVILSEKLQKYVDKENVLNGGKLVVSIAHDGEYATAIAQVF